MKGGGAYHGYLVHPGGWIESRRFPGRPMRTSEAKGYRRVHLHIDGQLVSKLVHVIVAEAFLGPKPAGYEVNHKDGNRANNAISNLEYVTPSQNARHALDVLGVERARGSHHGNAKLTEPVVTQIRADLRGGASYAELAERYGVHHTTIRGIAAGRSWRHVA